MWPSGPASHRNGAFLSLPLVLCLASASRSCWEGQRWPDALGPTGMKARCHGQQLLGEAGLRVRKPGCRDGRSLSPSCQRCRWEAQNLGTTAQLGLLPACLPLPQCPCAGACPHPGLGRPGAQLVLGTELNVCPFSLAPSLRPSGNNLLVKMERILENLLFHVAGCFLVKIVIRSP